MARITDMRHCIINSLILAAVVGILLGLYTTWKHEKVLKQKQVIKVPEEEQVNKVLEQKGAKTHFNSNSCFSSTLRGMLLLTKNRTAKVGGDHVILRENISTCGIQNLTEDMGRILHNYRSIYGQFSYQCISPAICHVPGDGNHSDYNVIASRLFLGAEFIQNNHLVVSNYDATYRLIPHTTHMIPIPTTLYDLNGPEDPRIYLDPISKDIAIIFNVIDIYHLRRIYIWWMGERHLVKLRSQQDKKSIKIEKNWVFIKYQLDHLSKENYDETLLESLRQPRSTLITYTLVPLQILQCNASGDCSFFYRQPGSEPFDTMRLFIRGGTPFEHYSGNYYYAFIHTNTVVCGLGRYKYGAHLAVLNMKYPPRIVYVSDPIMFHPRLLDKLPNDPNIGNAYFFPVSIGYQNMEDDVVHVGAHRSDWECWVTEVRGIFRVIKSVLDADANSSTVGDEANTVQSLTKLFSSQCSDWNRLISLPK